MPGPLAGIGYLLLGIDLLSRAYNEAQGRKTDNGLPPAVAGNLGRVRRARLGAMPTAAGVQGPAGAASPLWGQQGRLSAAEARRMSPLFEQPAKAHVIQARTLEERVREIRKKIRAGAQDPAVRNAAIAVLARRCPQKPGGWCIREKDWVGEAKALFGFVRANMRYTRDSALADTFVAPGRSLFDVKRGSGGGGDCDDYTITLGALLTSVGHTVKIRVAAVKNPGDPNPTWNHVWCVDMLPEGGAVARTGGREMNLDASVNQPPGWVAPKERIFKVRDFEV